MYMIYNIFKRLRATETRSHEVNFKVFVRPHSPPTRIIFNVAYVPTFLIYNRKRRIFLLNLQPYNYI